MVPSHPVDWEWQPSVLVFDGQRRTVKLLWSVCFHQMEEKEEGVEGEEDSGLEGVLSPEQKEMLDDFNANPDGNRTIDICVSREFLK